MRKNFNEIIATIVVLIILIATPIVISSYAPWKTDSKKRIIFLSAVASQGIWTEDIVNGTNYWNKKFKRAAVILRKNEDVILRFTSIDVTHTFYIPELGIGPIEVLPGHVYDFEYKATRKGSFTYYCTAVCGHCHFSMQGRFAVLNEKDFYNSDTIKFYMNDTAFTKVCTAHLSLNTNYKNIIEKGKAIFNMKSCFTCHGIEGKGGIKNFNYATKVIPQLNTLANKLKIPFKEDADSIIKLLSMNISLDSMADSPPFDNYNRFLAQYSSIRKKINEGASKLQKADSLGCDPPLFMPAWENSLNKEDIDAIIAYLISIYNWEEE